MPYKAKSIANAFIDLANRDGLDIDPLKLQKLLYFANGYYMAEHDGDPLINEYFEAWDYGPVVPTVFYEFREYGNRPIRRYAFTYDEALRRSVAAAPPIADETALETIRWVWENYKGFSGGELSQMTHNDDGPWQRARIRAANSQMLNERLEIGDLKSYFAELVN